MRILLLKQEVLDSIKGNLDQDYQNYFIHPHNDWIKEKFEDPFITFKEVQDFSLCNLDSNKTKGEIDLENCKIIYSHLNFLTESQACDERLWAGLTNGTFYEYMRERWDYDKKHPEEKAIGQIETRYFFKGGTRAGMYRNTLSKCWWVGKLLYDNKLANPWTKIEILGSNDFSTKVSDIFYNYTFISNETILNGLIDCLKYYKDKGITLSEIKHIRPSLQWLNAIGGATILDFLTYEEISSLLKDNINKIISNSNSSMLYDNNTMVEDNILDDEEDNIEYLPIGTKVTICKEDKGLKKIFKIDYASDGNLTKPSKILIEKKLNDMVEYDGLMYKITNIEKP